MKKIFYILLLTGITVYALCDFVNTFYYSVKAKSLFLWIWIPLSTIFSFFLGGIVVCICKKIENKVYEEFCYIVSFIIFLDVFLSFMFLLPRGYRISMQEKLSTPTHICSGYVTNEKRGHIIEFFINGQRHDFYQFTIHNNYENSCHLVKIDEKDCETGITIEDYPSYLQELYCFDGVPYSKLNKINNLKVVEKEILKAVSNKNAMEGARFISCVVVKESENICFYEALQSDEYIWASYNSRLHEGDSVLIKFSSENVAFFNIYKEKPTKEEYDMCLNKEGISLSDSLYIPCPAKYQLKSRLIKIEIEKTSNDYLITEIFGSRYREFIIPEIEPDK